MASPNGLTTELKREIETFYSVMKYYHNTAQSRVFNFQIPFLIRSRYFTLNQYAQDAMDNAQELWRKLRTWTSTYNTVPAVFEPESLGGLAEAKLIRVMATQNLLSDDQVNTGFSNEDFVLVGKTDWEAYFEVFDATLDLSLVFCGRVERAVDQWRELGFNPRESEIGTMLTESVGAGAKLRNDLVTLAIAIKDQRNLIDLPELQLRAYYIKTRAQLTGSIYALNRGLQISSDTDQSLPNEIDPDIRTGRDFPEMIAA